MSSALKPLSDIPIPILLCTCCNPLQVHRKTGDQCTLVQRFLFFLLLKLIAHLDLIATATKGHIPYALKALPILDSMATVTNGHRWHAMIGSNIWIMSEQSGMTMMYSTIFTAQRYKSPQHKITALSINLCRNMDKLLTQHMHVSAQVQMI